MELTAKNNRFVADGLQRFFRTRKNLPTAEEIGKKYAGKIASATPAEKTKIHREMALELLRREKTASHQPSAGTLW